MLNKKYIGEDSKKKVKMNTQNVIKSIIINCLQMHLTSINFLKSKSKKNKIDSKMFSQEKQRLESSWFTSF